MNIGDRIKKVRKSLDLTQGAFATRIGSVQNTITGYESGRRNPSAPVISLICKEFNVNEEWLRNGTGEMFNPEPCDELDSLADKFNLSHGEYIFLEKYLKLKREERDNVFDFIMDVCSAIGDSGVSGTADAAPDLRFLISTSMRKSKRTGSSLNFRKKRRQNRLSPVVETTKGQVKRRRSRGILQQNFLAASRSRTCGSNREAAG